jgi:hypothetical protein
VIPEPGGEHAAQVEGGAERHVGTQRIPTAFRCYNGCACNGVLTFQGSAFPAHAPKIVLYWGQVERRF